MKAETLKPFITSPSVTEYVGNRKRNIIVIGLSIFLFILIASLFGFTIWNSIRVTQLQKRIESLNKFVDNMHKRLGLDYLDELNEFENNYANHDYPIDHSDDDDDEGSEEEEEDDDSQLLNNFDYDEEKKGSLTHANGKGSGKDHVHSHGHGYGRMHSKNPRKEDGEDFESGSGDYDDDDDEEDDDDLYDDDDDDNGNTNEDNGDRLFDDFEKFVGNKKRKPRSVSHSIESKLEHKNGHVHKVHNKTDSKEDEHKSKKDLKQHETQLRLVFNNNKNDDETTEKLKDNNEKESKKDLDKLHESQLKHKGSEKEKHLKGHQYHDYILYPYTQKKRIHTHRNHGDGDEIINSRTSSENHRKIKGKTTKSRNGRENQNHRRLRTGKLYLHNHHQHHQQDRRNKNIIAAHFNLNRLHVSEDSKKDNEALLNHQRDFENSIYLPTISSWTTKNQLSQQHNKQQKQKEQQMKQQENHKIEKNNNDDDDDGMQQDEPQPEKEEPEPEQKHNHHEQKLHNHNNHESHKIDDVTPGILATQQINTNTEIKKKVDHQVKEQEGISIKNGIVTIKIPGLYYIYSQIFYHNNKDRNGYWIYHNAKPYIQCLLTIPNDNIEKGNTCYTSGILYLHRGDTVHIKDMYKDHNAILGTSKSFFGLVRLGDPEIYHNNNNR